ncbi:DNA-binding protein [Streptomyces pratensis]|uniref:DNA-binding protein n=1 Tax=Streptomyces pratensis TaxID=1169025 RepID=UPI0030183E25
MPELPGPPADDFPHAVGNPARRALRAAGCTRLVQLTAMTVPEILALHGVGPKAVRVLREALAAEGLSFAKE